MTTVVSNFDELERAVSCAKERDIILVNGRIKFENKLLIDKSISIYGAMKDAEFFADDDMQLIEITQGAVFVDIGYMFINVENITSEYVIHVNDSELMIDNCFIKGDINNNIKYGINVSNAHVFICHTDISGFDFGIAAVDSTHVTVSDCVVCDCKTNIYLRATSNVDITLSNIVDSVSACQGHSGILAELCRRIFIQNNVIADNVEHGIYLSGCERVSIVDNEIYGNKMHGIRLGKYGDDMRTGSITIFDNVIMRNKSGINMSEYVNSVMVYENIIRNNSNFGIDRGASGDNAANNNFFVNNTLSQNASIDQLRGMESEPRDDVFINNKIIPHPSFMG